MLARRKPRWALRHRLVGGVWGSLDTLGYVPRYPRDCLRYVILVSAGLSNRNVDTKGMLSSLMGSLSSLYLKIPRISVLSTETGRHQVHTALFHTILEFSCPLFASEVSLSHFRFRERNHKRISRVEVELVSLNNFPDPWLPPDYSCIAASADWVTWIKQVMNTDIRRCC